VTNYNFGAVVAVGATRRIKVITIRHAGSDNTVVSIFLGAVVKVSIDVPAQTTRVWSSEDGIEFLAGEQPIIQSSDVTGGSTFVAGEGIEV